MRRFGLIALVIALAVSACSIGNDTGTLTVYSGRSEELIGPLIQQFEEESGIDVAVRYGGSTEIAATLLEEGGRSPADVVFTQDPASIGVVALEGLLDRLPDGLLSLVPERFSDTDGRWVGVSGRARTVVYDTTLLTPADLPATEDGLIGPEWQGQVGIAPANGSFLAFVAAKILLDGEQATLAWLEGMAANGSPAYANNASIVSAVTDGQLESGLVNHYYLLRRLREQPQTSAANYFFPEPTAGSLVMPAGAGILSSTDNRDAAEAFVAFLLSEGSQQYFASETFEYPLVPGVPANEMLPPIGEIATPDIDLSELATVLDRATDLVSRAGLL
ncbi:MAG: iron ABC transporter substrate-binding protein [Acidimicrobiia bacterium]|nr:MAG: iron ABC transporter substrate-binding protein [Acidimicrobiia bacterium]